MLLAALTLRYSLMGVRVAMHTTVEIEEKIRQRYRQPKGVEQFGIEPVPPELKTVRWLDIFSIIFGFALNPGSMLVGGLAVLSGLSFVGAVGAITCGVLLATIPYTIMCAAPNGSPRSCARSPRPTGLPIRRWPGRWRSLPF